MGKRSNFERVPRDFYPTPFAAVPPLIPHLRRVRTFAEPCCGDGALVRHLESLGLRCVYAGDIATGQDALALDSYGNADAIITNPPFRRPLMHALIQHFARILPAWLLLETDWASTKQAGPFMPSCSNIVSVGRLRWIEGTTMSGMQNFAWYRFDARHSAGPIFHAHSVPVSSRVSLCERSFPMKKAKDSSPSLSDDAPIAIAKPGEFSLDKFRSKHAAALANVETLLTALPHHSLAQAKDFVRLHPDEAVYWSPELCFVNVPIKGQKQDTLHLIDEELAMRFLQPARILRFRLALASKPNDVFFLCHVPTRNMDNSWNESNSQGCEQARSLWTLLTSRKEDGVEAYKIDKARDPKAFPDPNWPTQSLADLINVTFVGRLIETEDHPGLLRLIGERQSTS